MLPDAEFLERNHADVFADHLGTKNPLDLEIACPMRQQLPFLHELPGDWSANGNGYDLHVTLNGAEKFMTAKAEDLRLSIKDGKNLLVFDRAD